MDRASSNGRLTPKDFAECGGRGHGETRGEIVFAHAHSGMSGGTQAGMSGTALFADCLRMFRRYPLAVAPAARPGLPGGGRSMLLRHQAEGTTRCYVLREGPVEFAIWPAGHGYSTVRRIRPGDPVPASVHRVVSESMPVPVAGTLLGWISDSQVCALLSVQAGPEIRVLPLAGSDPLHWPPRAASPLSDGSLWEYLDRGQLTNLGPVICAARNRAYWVPSQNPQRARLGHGCAVVTANLAADDYWLPAGVYLDHWLLREGLPGPRAAELLALPGVTSLARRPC
jgi:hypothetical protein